MTITQPNCISSMELPTHSFVSGVHVLPVQDSVVQSGDADGLDQAFGGMISKCIKNRTPVIESADPQDDSAIAALCFPVFKNDEIVSLVVMLATKQLPQELGIDELVGVFEIWCPEPPHEEVALSAGYFGKMERFSNVSSFVRFERGTGLPGQVWEKRQAVIHDDLSNHPGFLRAAGASADLLQTAVGIPIFGTDFIASVLLISSDRTPIARGFEVWHRAEDSFELLGSSHVEFDEAFSATPRSDAGKQWASKIEEAGGAVMVTDPATLACGRDVPADGCVPSSGLAIPQFSGDAIDSFLVLLF